MAWGNTESSCSKPRLLGKKQEKMIKLEKERLPDWPAETDFDSGWQQRVVYMCHWHSLVLEMMSSIKSNLYLVYAEHDMIY